MFEGGFDVFEVEELSGGFFGLVAEVDGLFEDGPDFAFVFVGEGVVVEGVHESGVGVVEEDDIDEFVFGDAVELPGVVGGEVGDAEAVLLDRQVFLGFGVFEFEGGVGGEFCLGGVLLEDEERLFVGLLSEVDDGVVAEGQVLPVAVETDVDSVLLEDGCFFAGIG